MPPTAHQTACNELLDKNSWKALSPRITACAGTVALAYQRLGTWQAVAEFYADDKHAYNKGSFYRLVHDIHFRPSEYMLRQIERKGAPRPPVVVERCPTCDEVHVLGDCRGKVGDLAILAPDERIVRRNGAGKHRKRYLRLAVGDLPPDVAKWWRGLTPQQRAAIVAVAAHDPVPAPCPGEE